MHGSEHRKRRRLRHLVNYARAACLGWLGLMATTSRAEPVAITVELANATHPPAAGKLGVNLNAFTDGELYADRPEALANALRTMGVRWLRYPGGEKSDGLAWSTPPYDTPRPTPINPAVWPSGDPRVFQDGQWTRPPLDFDQFIALCRAVNAEPIVVLAYDAMYPVHEKAKASSPERQAMIDLAAAWVRYANVDRGYGVRYWELGNESYMSGSYNGRASAEQYAADLNAFRDAMAAVDPSILLGAQGPNGLRDVGHADRLADRDTPWWPRVQQTASDAIGFLALHQYPAWEWRDYDGYRAGFQQLTTAADRADRLGRALDRPVFITEYHVHDWSDGGWPGRNDLGHALALAEGLGRCFASPSIDAVVIWTTRWIEQPIEPSLWDAYDADLNPRLSAEVMRLWSQAAKLPRVAAQTPPDLEAAAFAFANADEARLLIVHRADHARTVILQDAAGLPVAWLSTRYLGDARDDATDVEWRDQPVGDTLDLPARSIIDVRLAR